ncbi:hypothetical protein [Streptomyces nodosus]|uniref:Uncharacterized protein n=1 Tax=Streptomyces nodosus TaxID=40318 RepID=A0A0B5DPL3_9ACTN|nr:hypothetical protein [Streptomyces nodosus]AJE42007.1 hypothetical protein SNOD_19720 [Streptomyces nodosus]MBB4793257.1 hypothetical protein [Streptomyces nodosus]QEV40529.1 hypothetical protein CP978_20045 [Streptomyces nodosus]
MLTTGESDPRCKGPPLDPFQQDRACRSELRQWSALLGILALSLIVTVVAATTAVYAKLLSRLARTPGRDGSSAL